MHGMRREPYTQSEIDAMMADPPEEVLGPVPDDAVCGTCKSFGLGWQGGHNWNCRRGDRLTSGYAPACPKWRQRPEPDPPEISTERMREVSEVLNFVITPQEPAPVKRRKRPEGLRGSNEGVVYFLDCGEFTKIGHTAGWIEDRLKGIETHNPFELVLWGLVAGDVKFERMWHADLDEYRYRNEWFRLTADVREQIKVAIRRHGGELYD